MNWTVRLYDAHDGWMDIKDFPTEEEAKAHAVKETAALPQGNRDYGEYYRAFPSDTRMVFDAKYDPYRTGRNALNALDEG